ncbi:hypothetical protein [Propionivibrio sp.]|uniref:hypothetical protein n=1 Tax=Propionivibrio sp. TaxID=2212460 RepID=UPI003BF027F4
MRQNPSILVLGESFESVSLLYSETDLRTISSDFTEAEKLAASNEAGIMLDWRLKKRPQNEYYIRKLTLLVYTYMTMCRTFEMAYDTPNAVVGWSFFRPDDWRKTKPVYACRTFGITSVSRDEIFERGITERVNSMLQHSKHLFVASDYHSTSLVQQYLNGVELKINKSSLN